MEDRIERLENLVTLQDRTIEKLNDALFDQQRQIQDLEKLTKRLEICTTVCHQFSQEAFVS